jgi:hypothetical protein
LDELGGHAEIENAEEKEGKKEHGAILIFGGEGSQGEGLCRRNLILKLAEFRKNNRHALQF